MEHIGIDLGGRESQVCVRAADGTIIEEKRVLTSSIGVYLRLRPHSRVVMETCAEAFALARQASKIGHEVRVVPATLVRSLGVGARGVKNDVRDARVQSEASCRMDLPGVHVPSTTSQELRSLLNMRDGLVRGRTRFINAVRGYLRTQLIRVRTATTTFPKAVRQVMLERADGMPFHVVRHLTVIETLNQQIKDAEKELAQLTKTHAVCRLLMTAPGIGPVTSARFVSALDTIERFPHAHAVESYLGLTPGEHSSSERERRTGVTKAGPTAIRACLIQAAWSILNYAPEEPLALWALNIAKRQHKNKAVAALARKLAGILYAMWRDNTPYNSNRTVAAVM